MDGYIKADEWANIGAHEPWLARFIAQTPTERRRWRIKACFFLDKIQHPDS